MPLKRIFDFAKREKVLTAAFLLAVTILAVAFIDSKRILDADYALLFTFVFFFVFVGNMGNIEPFRRFIEGIIVGRETVVSILLSQIISNMPATLMISSFTDNYAAVLIGVNLGGLGTLIASMASLISYKYIAGVADAEPRGSSVYIREFTIINVVMLAGLYGISLI